MGKFDKKNSSTPKSNQSNKTGGSKYSGPGKNAQHGSGGHHSQVPKGPNSKKGSIR